MAHSVLHFAAGVTAGTVIGLPAVAAAWLRGRPLAAPMGRLLLAAYGLGVLAVVPNVIGALGLLPAAALERPWMNVFVLHPLIDGWKSGGLLIGELAVGGLFAAHYALIVASIAARRSGRAGAGRSEG